jgi:hypothetical protein
MKVKIEPNGMIPVKIADDGRNYVVRLIMKAVKFTSLVAIAIFQVTYAMTTTVIRIVTKHFLTPNLIRKQSSTLLFRSTKLALIKFLR